MRASTAASAPPAEPPFRFRGGARLRLGAVAGCLLVGAFAAAGILQPILTSRVLHRDCNEMPKLEDAPLPPGRGHWLGTDDQGRDLRVRMLCGARTSFVVGLGAEVIALALGVAIGGWAGFRGGRADAALMRFTDLVLAVPFPLVAIAVVALTEQRGALPLVLLLGLLGWPGIARLVRARLLSVTRSEFVAAARAAGACDLRVLFRHALPAGIAPAWAAAAVGVAGNILAEAWLSFIGLGDAGRTSWGTILQDARAFASQAWWFALFPGLAISLAILGFILLGDALRDALDRQAGSTAT